jgi:anti-anti-sigma factor
MDEPTPLRSGEAFQVSIEPDRNGPVVKVFGELDLAAAEAFERAIQEAFAGDPPSVLIDLRQVAFVDSTGLRALIAVMMRWNANRERLWIKRGVSPAVAHLLEFVQLDDGLPFAD